MKRIIKTGASAAALLLAAAVLTAQAGFDFSGTGGDGSDAASDSSDDFETAAQTDSSDGFSGFDFGQDDQSGSGGFGAVLQSVSIGGTLKMDSRAYLDDPKQSAAFANTTGTSDGKDMPLYAVPDATLDFTYQNDSSEVNFKLNFSEDSIKTYNEDVIQELTARSYLGNVILEGGKEKLVWGKGRKLHVIDNFCATNYTDFIYPDYIDRRLAVPMLRGIYDDPEGRFRLEAVYAPVLVTDRLAKTSSAHGMKFWTPDTSALKTLVSTKAMTAIGSRYAAYAAASKSGSTAAGMAATDHAKSLSAANYLSENTSEVLYPDTYKLKYSQYGVRVTGTIGSFDWGASYYYGWYKQPTVDYAKLGTYVYDYIYNGGSPSLATGVDYDRLQVFGLEGEKAFGPLNARFELAYNLTDDTAGDDPAVRNNSISWVPGFDVDIPIHNMSLNVQELGTFVLKSGKIKDNGAGDYEYDSENRYTNNKLAVNISDTFLHENLKLDITGTWGIERGDFVLTPKMTYTIKTGMDVIASGMWIYCRDKNSEFYTWRHNSFAQLGVKYVF